eukprot:4649910-Pyramimonas_sp.AAC.1
MAAVRLVQPPRRDAERVRLERILGKIDVRAHASKRARADEQLQHRVLDDREGPVGAHAGDRHRHRPALLGDLPLAVP